MAYRTILFDFDGTLADSRAVGIEVLNSLAREFGYSSIEAEEIPTLQSMSARELLTERAGIPAWNIFKARRFERRAREELDRHSASITLFPGITDMLTALRERGYEIGVVTSNDEKIVYEAFGRAGTDVHFVHAGSRVFGKARAIQRAMKEYGLEAGRTIYVGDELRDIEACKKAGIDMIAVGWGFNAPEVLKNAGARVASTPAELLSMLA